MLTNTAETSSVFHYASKASINLYLSEPYFSGHKLYTEVICTFCKLNTHGIKPILFWENQNHFDNNFKEVFPYGKIVFVHIFLFSRMSNIYRNTSSCVDSTGSSFTSAVLLARVLPYLVNGLLYGGIRPYVIDISTSKRTQTGKPVTMYF